jgi:hypothetical protein
MQKYKILQVGLDEIELPAPDEVRRAVHSLENNKHQVWTRQAYQQKYIKLEVQL